MAEKKRMTSILGKRLENVKKEYESDVNELKKLIEDEIDSTYFEENAIHILQDMIKLKENIRTTRDLLVIASYMGK